VPVNALLDAGAAAGLSDGHAGPHSRTLRAAPYSHTELATRKEEEEGTVLAR
jgi:hypothetical protein